jgi:hypothetical protein
MRKYSVIMTVVRINRCLTQAQRGYIRPHREAHLLAKLERVARNYSMVASPQECAELWRELFACIAPSLRRENSAKIAAVYYRGCGL